jgi:hypothetical protein
LNFFDEEIQVRQVTSLPSRDWSWAFWPAVPLYPYGRRRTLRQEIIRDEIWTFDQLQGIFYVAVPIRMTAIKLRAGGLLIYAPVAPTRECLKLVGELEAAHGSVKYIILPTASGLEHKVFAGPFARHFPNAEVFVAPEQWSFPLNLPLSWLGFPASRTQVLPPDSRQAPFAEEFDYAILGPISLKLGSFVEVAFYHKPSRTLLATDIVVAVPEMPPPILQLDPYPLLFHAKDSATEAIADSEVNRRKGWQRISLFAFYFRPHALETVNWLEAFRRARQAPDRAKQAYFGLFPFHWQEGWQQSFAALRGNGRLFVAPVLQALILNRAPQATLAWAERVASWDFQRIIPCHFDSPLTASPREFRQAFAFLENSPTLPEVDFALLRQLDAFLRRWGIVPPL